MSKQHSSLAQRSCRARSSCIGAAVWPLLPPCGGEVKFKISDTSYLKLLLLGNVSKLLVSQGSHKLW